MDLNILNGLSINLPSEREKGNIYHTTDTKKIYLNDMVLEDTENVKNEFNNKISELTSTIQSLNEEINNLKKELASVNGILHLRAYLFDLDGTYTKEEFENVLSVTLEQIVERIGMGDEITIFSKDDVSANISVITESNYTLTEDGVLNTLTLQWHQYQLWCNLYAVLNADGTYTITIEKA